MAVYHCAFPLPLPTMYNEIVESTSVSSVSGQISKLSRKGPIASSKAANGPMTLLEQILMRSGDHFPSDGQLPCLPSSHNKIK